MPETKEMMVKRFLEARSGEFAFDSLCNHCWKEPPQVSSGKYQDTLGYTRYYCGKCIAVIKESESSKPLPIPPLDIRKLIKQEAVHRGLQDVLCMYCCIRDRSVCIEMEGYRYGLCLECGVSIGMTIAKTYVLAVGCLYVYV